MERLHAAAVALALAAAPPAAAQVEPPRPLRIDQPQTWAVTGTAAGAYLLTVAFAKQLGPSHCRWCESNAFDTSLRDALKWKDTGAASLGSDVLQVGVPILATGGLMLSAFHAGGRDNAGEDLLVTAEAVSVALLAMQVSKLAFGRLRPYAWADPGSVQGRDAYASFWSGHTASTFAVASAAGTVARLRGYRHWGWILGVGLAGAATCGYLRIAADRHWTTDVLAGALTGSLAGFGLPVWLHQGRPGSGAPGTGGAAPTALRVAPFSISGTF